MQIKYQKEAAKHINKMDKSQNKNQDYEALSKSCRQEILSSSKGIQMTIA